MINLFQMIKIVLFVVIIGNHHFSFGLDKETSSIQGPLCPVMITLYSAPNPGDVKPATAKRVSIKTKYLQHCNAVMPFIGKIDDAFTLNDIDPSELENIATCIRLAYTRQVAVGKQAKKRARVKLNKHTNTPKKLYNVFLAANFLDHPTLQPLCLNKWTEKYSRLEQFTLPSELAYQVSTIILAKTKFLDNARSWLLQKERIDPIRVLRHPQGSVWSVACNHDGSRIATGDLLGNIQIFNKEDADPEIEIPAHKTGVCGLIFLNDTMLASCAQDGSINYWNVTTGDIMEKVDCEDTSFPFVLKANTSSQLVAYDIDKKVVVIDVENNISKQLIGHTGVIMDITFHPTDLQLISGDTDGTLIIWDLTNATAITTLAAHNESILCLKYSPDGTLIAAGSDDKTIAVYDTATQKRIARLTGHTRGIWAIAISTDNQFLYSISKDGSLKIWHIQSASLLKNLVHYPRSDLQALAQMPDGTLITASHKGIIAFWNIERSLAAIIALQKRTRYNITLEQAHLLQDAYQAPQQAPLDCSHQKYAPIFRSFEPMVQKLLIKHLHVKPPAKKR